MNKKSKKYYHLPSLSRTKKPMDGAKIWLFVECHRRLLINAEKLKIKFLHYHFTFRSFLCRFHNNLFVEYAKYGPKKT